MATVEFKLLKTPNIQATLTMTTTLKEWKRLREQLEPGNWPSLELRNKIQELLDRAEKEYWTTT